MAEQSWVKNPWMWGGCGCCLGIVLIPIIIGTLGLGGAFWAFRNADVGDEALALARSHPTVVERLGEPMKLGWQMDGSINIDNDGGLADYSMPISGPEGEGRLFVRAHRQDGEWNFEEAFVRVDGDRIDLLRAPAEEDSNPSVLPGAEY